jgi:hypothetical protein
MEVVEAGSIWIRLGLDPSKLTSGLSEAKANMVKWRDETNDSSKDTAKWGAAIGATVAPAIAAGLAIKDLTDTAIRYQDAIEQFSNVTGINEEKTQRWRSAAIATDTDFGSFTMTMQYLNARITDTGAEGDNLRATLTGIGIAVKDANGDYRDMDSLYKDILTKLSAMPSAQEKDAAAKGILGRSWYTQAEMIRNADTALQAYNSTNAVAFSDSDLEKINQSKIRMAEFGDQVDIVKAKIGVGLMDTFDWTQNGIAIWSAASQGNIAGIGKAADEQREKIAALDQAVRELWEEETLPTIKSTGTGFIDARRLLVGGAVGTVAPAGSSAALMIDPLAGLSAHDAAIKDLSDYKIPDLESKLIELRTSGTATYSDIAAASLAVIEAKQNLIELTNEETDAQKELKTATDDLTSAKEKLADIDKDYYRQMTALNPRDVRAARDLYIKHNYAVEDQQTKISTATQAVKKSGDLIINLDGKQLAKVSNVVSGDLTPDKLTARGVRVD